MHSSMSALDPPGHRVSRGQAFVQIVYDVKLVLPDSITSGSTDLEPLFLSGGMTLLEETIV